MHSMHTHNCLMEQKPKSLKNQFKRRHATTSITFDQCYSAGKVPTNLPEKNAS